MTPFKKNIVLISSTGIIGSYLYKKFDNHSSDYLYGTYYKNKNFEDRFFVNLSSKNSITNFINEIKNINILIFTVGLAHKKGKDSNFKNFKNINYNSLVNLLDILEKSKKTPKKIIFLSTISIYGENFSKKFYYENSSTNPISPYAKTKLLAENYLSQRYKHKVWILRLSPVYSNEFKLNIKRRTEIFGFKYKVGNGQNKLSLCNIDNIYQVIKSIISDKVPYGVYNISDKMIYTFDDILDEGVITINIPKFLIKFMLRIGTITNNIFLIENSIKLLTDNIFSSAKIQNHVDLKYSIFDLKEN